MASKKRAIKKIRRPLTTNEYVVCRSAHTGRPRKFRSDVKLVLEVYSKKSRKRVGVLNDVEKGTPIARRFAGTQFRVLTTRNTTPNRAKKKSALGVFKLYSTRPIIEQIPTDICIAIENEIRHSHGVAFDFEVKGPHERGFTNSIYYDRKIQRNQLRLDITLAIVNIVSDLNIRMSPKKFARFKNKNHRRMLTVTTRFQRLK